MKLTKWIQFLIRRKKYMEDLKRFDMIQSVKDGKEVS